MREFEHADGPMLDVWIEVTNPEVLFSGPNKKATHGFEFCEPGFYFKDELSGETVQPVDLWRLLRVSPPIDIL